MLSHNMCSGSLSLVSLPVFSACVLGYGFLVDLSVPLTQD